MLSLPMTRSRAVFIRHTSSGQNLSLFGIGTRGWFLDALLQPGSDKPPVLLFSDFRLCRYPAFPLRQGGNASTNSRTLRLAQ
jgi:hypothetical protein